MAPDADIELTHVAVADEGRTVRATLRVPAEHPLLRGHFPGDPVVPGVLLLDAARRACEQALGRSFAIRAVEVVRFLQPVRPGQAVSLVVRAAADGDEVDADGEWQLAAVRLATFRLRLGARA